MWKKRLAVNLKSYGIEDNMMQWMQSDMHNMRTMVRLDGSESKKILLFQGVSQRGVISPTLFLVYINVLVKIHIASLLLPVRSSVHINKSPVSL